MIANLFYHMIEGIDILWWMYIDWYILWCEFGTTYSFINILEIDHNRSGSIMLKVDKMLNKCTEICLELWMHKLISVIILLHICNSYNAVGNYVHE